MKRKLTYMGKSFLVLPASFLLLAFFAGSCINDNVTNIVDNTYYTPELSLPIGYYDFDIEEIFSDYWNDIIDNTDTANIIDSLAYNNEYFENYRYLDFELPAEFDFTFLTDKVENIKSLMMRLNCINGIPGKISMQVYFLDESENRVDSLFQDNWLTIDAAGIDSDGNVINEAELWKYDTYLGQKIIDRLPDIYYVDVYTRLETEDYNTTHIIYLDKQNFWAQLGFRIKFEIPLNEN